MITDRSKRLTTAGIGLLVLAACATVATGGVVGIATPDGPRSRAVPAEATTSTIADPLPLPASVQALPAAVYDAVIPGLMAFPGRPGSITAGYSIREDIAVYGVDRRTAVARIPVRDFVGAPTTVVGGGDNHGWTLVLTPARVALPSKSGGRAPAQSAGWVHASDLRDQHPLRDRIVVSASRQTLTIERDGAITDTFSVGVGAPGTPTPTNTTGYLQQRYLDPRQGETVHAIQLTSLHATAADEPYAGNDGGLIGIHYNATSTGAVSHGCIRLDAVAITAVDALPLGTPITIVP